MSDKSLDNISSFCLNENSKNPIEILEKMISKGFCHMDGPEHHIIVGASLITAYKNAGGNINLNKALAEMHSSINKLLEKKCNIKNTYSDKINTELSIFLGTMIGSMVGPIGHMLHPVTNTAIHMFLGKMGEIVGSRCCKRYSYLAIIETVHFTKEKLGIEMDLHKVKCSHSTENNLCIKSQCPFYPL